ncbi:MAG: AI-2E family transporter [Anaerolineae bacterium]|nr:AI-2E family transporter [Anaerolineae bacterium]
MTKHLIRIGTAVMTTLLGLVVLWQFRTVAVYLVASFALAVTVRPVVKHWMRQRAAVRLALILLYLVVLGSTAFFLFMAGRSALNEIEQMTSAVSLQGEWKLPQWLMGTPFQKTLIARLPTPNRLFEAVVGDRGQHVLPAILSFTQGIGSLVSSAAIVLLLSFYWSSNQAHFERLWLSLLPPGLRAQVRDTWQTIELDLSVYIRGQIAQSLLAGLLLGLGYWAIGSPYALLLALTCALLCLFPVVGAPLALLSPLLVGLLTGVQLSLWTTLYTLVVLIALGAWVKPRFFKRRQDDTILTVVILMALSDVFGPIGIIVAPPISAVCQILWSSLVSRRVVAASAAQISDLRERQAQIWAVAEEMEGPPSPVVTSSLRRLTRLIERAEPVLQAIPEDRVETHSDRS